MRKPPEERRDLRYENDEPQAPALPPHAGGGPRRALLIGNSRYREVPRLKNPQNDVTAMEKGLKRFGFEVTVVTDATLATMTAQLTVLAGQMHQGGVALFYFSGHGAQVAGENYLIPIDFRLTSETKIASSSLAASKVQRTLENANPGINLLIFDACRNNPFRKEGAAGLAPMDTRLGTLIAFSTGPGQVADDNATEQNGLYTKTLLAVMEQPLDVVDVFRHVRKLVYAESAGQQSPWFHEDLLEPFAFRRPSDSAVLQSAMGNLRDGLVHYQAGNFSAATGKFEQAVRVNPSDPYAHNALGMAYRSSHLLEPAIAAFSRAISLKPDYATAYFNRGVAYLLMPNYELATQDFTWAVDEDQANPVLLSLRGKALLGLGEPEHALADVTRSLELNSKDAYTWALQAAVFNRLGRYAEALTSAKMALEIKPDSCEALQARQYARRGLGDPGGAAADGREAMKACAQRVEQE